MHESHTELAHVRTISRLTLWENWPGMVDAAVMRTLELQAAREAELLIDTNAPPKIAAVQSDVGTASLAALTKTIGMLVSNPITRSC